MECHLSRSESSLFDKCWLNKLYCIVLVASHRFDICHPGYTAAERAALLKHTKYAAIKVTHEFVPVAIETLGLNNKEGTSFLCEKLQVTLEKRPFYFREWL